ncbi:T9SS type A sorting domain-containing protein [Chitinophagaceae bacterium MMS25-I14]
MTSTTCSNDSVFINGYAVHTFTLPISNISVAAGSTNLPSVTASNDTFYISGLKTDVNMQTTTPNFYIKFNDSCGNRDSAYVYIGYSFSNIPIIYIGDYNNYYNLCDSSFYLKETGLIQNVTYTYYDNNGNLQSGAPTAIVQGGGDLRLKGIPNDVYLNISYEDSCGNLHTTSLFSYFNQYVNVTPAYTCGVNGLSGSFVPVLNTPYTFQRYSSLNPSAPQPVIQMSGDTINISGYAPFNNSYFVFTDACNDSIYAYMNDYSLLTQYPVFAGSANCNNTYALSVKTTGTGPFYDPQPGYGMPASTVLTSVFYAPDSLVISGFPSDTLGGISFSYRDSSCHNRAYSQYFSYGLGRDGFAVSWAQPDSCGANYVLKGTLVAPPPYTNITFVSGPNTPGVITNGNQITLYNLEAATTGQDTLYHFTLTDSCGRLHNYYLGAANLPQASEVIPTALSATGGCVGSVSAGNAILTLPYYYAYSYPPPYVIKNISGNGTPSASISRDTFHLSHLTADSTYLIQFKDSCGHAIFMNYVAASENTPMNISVSVSIEGICISNMDSAYALRVGIVNQVPPCNIKLTGPVNDSVLNSQANSVFFNNLVPGTYQVRVEDSCNNIQTLNYTITSAAPIYKSLGYAGTGYDGCDSIQYNFALFLGTNNTLVPNNIRLRGPFNAYVVRGVDTFRSQYGDASTLYSNGSTLAFTFPRISPLTTELLTVTDGCNDTFQVPAYAYYYPYSSTICKNNNLYAMYNYLVPNISHLNFPIRFVLTSSTGNVDTSTIYIYNSTQLDTILIASGQSATYQILDSCNELVFNAYFYGPAPLGVNQTTRMCYPAVGPGKGNVSFSLLNYTSDSVRYHLISGPAVIFNDTTLISYSGMLLQNKDTGTYTIQATELSTCMRAITFQLRIEPYLDSISYVFVPGCVNANKLVVYAYDNSIWYLPYATLYPAYAYVTDSMGSNSISAPWGDTIYNLKSNAKYLIHLNCITDTVHSPAYLQPTIGASAGFSCVSGFSLAIMGLKGVQPYTYEILSGSPANYTAPSQTSNVFTGLPGPSHNSYQVRITDNCGNAFTSTVYVDSIRNPLTQVGRSCLGSNYAMSVDSIPNMLYSWSKPDGTMDTTTSLSFNPITAADTGRYTLYITNLLTNCTSDVVQSLALKDCGALPLDFINVSAQNYSTHNQVAWTVSNNGQLSYTIERSADGRSFAAVGAETHYENRAGYVFSDLTPLTGNNFYRIKALYKDGNYKYSDIVSAAVKVPGMFTITASPNPVTNILHVTTTGYQGGSTFINLRDISGKIIKTITVTSDETLIDMSELSSGIYLVQYTGPHNSETIKVMK